MYLLTKILHMPLRFNDPLFAWQKLRELANLDIAKEPQALLEFVPLPD